MGNLRFQDGGPKGGFLEEDRIDALLDFLLVDPQTARGIRLRIQVDEKNANLAEGQLTRKIHGGGGLADPSLLVTDGDGSGHVPRGTSAWAYALAFASRSAASCCRTVSAELMTQYNMKPDGRL